MVRNDRCGVGVAYGSNIAGMYCSICFMCIHWRYMYMYSYGSHRVSCIFAFSF